LTFPHKGPRELILPLLALRGLAVFPGMTVSLQVGRPPSLSAVESAIDGDGLIMLATQKESDLDEPGPDDIFRSGSIGIIKEWSPAGDRTLKIVVEGRSRAQIADFMGNSPHLTVRALDIEDPPEEGHETEALVRSLVEQYREYVRLSKQLPSEAVVTVTTTARPGKLADSIAAQLSLRLEDKQAVLASIDVRERLEKLYRILTREIEVMQLEQRIAARVKHQVAKTQKEYYLREQLKAIRSELGDAADGSSEAEEFREKIQARDLPPEVEQKALQEADRLERMPPMAAEAVVVRNYLEWILALPWDQSTQDCHDLRRAARVLDEDHYGLREVKDRILEFLAVRTLVDRMKGPILCLVGPPGVGKTSLAKSVARALGRKFVRVSLGGVRDEAEIRGHRRTYVGALPGRIVQGMRQAQSRNPVFLLDEVDKLGQDFRGDPASSLLEVLDPEQNSSFSDHFIEAALDLSEVLFITTANVSQTIPRPLLDRMEVIYISGYTEEDKVCIAQDFLWPKQLAEHGLDAAQVSISENALREVIRRYTREAGVRNLERALAGICRKAARRLVSGDTGVVRVSRANLERFLGKYQYRYGVAEKRHQVGVAMSVGWTETGGDVMPVEVAIAKGKGKFILTGKLGDVMRESAQTALSYLRSRSGPVSLDAAGVENSDIHLHVPQGAVPKEGPSAGLAIACALASAFSGLPVDSAVAMTGEITLRGQLLPVGGVKEKVLAAHRAGLTKVILPNENERDLDDIPPKVRRDLEFALLNDVDDAFRIALVGYESPGAEGTV